MSYVDGFVLPVPVKNLPAYKRMSRLMGKVWREHGALDYVECVGDAADGQQAVDMVGTVKPDVVLMDVRMPGTDGISATSLITEHEDLAGTRVLVLTTFEDDDLVLAALGNILGR